MVMKNNIFEFGDLFFLHFLGTVIGTSAACMWATIYFCVLKNSFLPTQTSSYISDASLTAYLGSVSQPPMWQHLKSVVI
ncbi:hypothetical protein ACHAWF_005644 [Thalassiosira exigua]